MVLTPYNIFSEMWRPNQILTRRSAGSKMFWTPEVLAMHHVNAGYGGPIVQVLYLPAIGRPN